MQVQQKSAHIQLFGGINFSGNTSAGKKNRIPFRAVHQINEHKRCNRLLLYNINNN